MARQREYLELVANAKGFDQVKRDVRGIRTEVDGLSKTTRESASSQREMNDQLRAGSQAFSQLKTMALAWAGAWVSVQGAMKIGEFIVDMDRLGNQFRAASGVLSNQLRPAGIGAAEALERLQRATLGTSSNVNLLSNSARAMVAFRAAGIDAAQAFEIVETTARFATTASVAFGMESEQSFERMITALSRGSTQLLDDFGIMIDQQDAMFEGMSQGEKKAAVLNEAIRQMTVFLDENSDSVAENISRVDKLKIAWENLKTVQTTVMNRDPATLSDVGLQQLLSNREIGYGGMQRDLAISQYGGMAALQYEADIRAGRTYNIDPRGDIRVLNERINAETQYTNLINELGLIGMPPAEGVAVEDLRSAITRMESQKSANAQQIEEELRYLLNSAPYRRQIQQQRAQFDAQSRAQLDERLMPAYMTPEERAAWNRTEFAGIPQQAPINIVSTGGKGGETKDWFTQSPMSQFGSRVAGDFSQAFSGALYGAVIGGPISMAVSAILKPFTDSFSELPLIGDLFGGAAEKQMEAAIRFEQAVSEMQASYSYAAARAQYLGGTPEEIAQNMLLGTVAPDIALRDSGTAGRGFTPYGPYWHFIEMLESGDLEGALSYAREQISGGTLFSESQIESGYAEQVISSLIAAESALDSNTSALERLNETLAADVFMAEYRAQIAAGLTGERSSLGIALAAETGMAGWSAISPYNLGGTYGGGGSGGSGGGGSDGGSGYGEYEVGAFIYDFSGNVTGVYVNGSPMSISQAIQMGLINPNDIPKSGNDTYYSGSGGSGGSGGGGSTDTSSTGNVLPEPIIGYGDITRGETHRPDAPWTTMKISETWNTPIEQGGETWNTPPSIGNTIPTPLPPERGVVPRPDAPWTTMKISMTIRDEATGAVSVISGVSNGDTIIIDRQRRRVGRAADPRLL